jgi:hypothetical protein
VCLPIVGYLQDSEPFIYFCDSLCRPLTGPFPLVLFPQSPFLHFITSSISGYFLTVELTDWISQLMNSYSSEHHLMFVLLAVTIIINILLAVTITITITIIILIVTILLTVTVTVIITFLVLFRFCFLFI